MFDEKVLHGRYYIMRKPVLIVMVGISASGKTSWANKLESSGFLHVSSDKIRGEICEGGVSDQSKNDEVFKIFHKSIRTALGLGHDVVAEATNITMKARRAIFENIKDIDCTKVAFVTVKSPVKCIRDNAYKENPVPRDVILKQIGKFQIPFNEEGFDNIIVMGDENNDNENENFIESCYRTMELFNQNNHHHIMTLGKHCKTTFDKFKLLGYSDAFNIGAFMHDVGKLFTQTIDEDGVAHYINHENYGSYYLLSNARKIMQSSNLDIDDFLNMLFLVNYHMLPFGFENEKVKMKWQKRFGDEKFKMLMQFNKCDIDSK